MKNHKIKTFAIWKDGKVIGYKDMTIDEANYYNSRKDATVYYGFDHKTNPDKYQGK